MRFFGFCVLLLVPFVSGCGDESSVPEELRAPPLQAATPETQDAKAPRGAAAVESPF